MPKNKDLSESSIFDKAEVEALAGQVIDYINAEDYEGLRAMAVDEMADIMNQERMDEAKAAGQAWLDALDTENEAAATEKYIAELEGDIMPIEMLIAFAESDGGAQVFGPEKTKEVAAHAKEIQAAGAKYCDCPACAAVEAILARKDEMLK